MSSSKPNWHLLERGLFGAAAIAVLLVLFQADVPSRLYQGLIHLWPFPLGSFQSWQADIFQQWQRWHPDVPTGSLQALLLPSSIGVVSLICFKIFQPKPTTFSRALVSVVGILLLMRYWGWRLGYTLNFDDPLSGVLCLLLLLAEGVGSIAALAGNLLSIFRVERLGEADICAYPVISGIYQPSVDVIIPTYNEPAEILRRTVVGCQAIDYPNKQVYLLDDQRRPEIRALAKELGCGYRDRPNNDHAKAGNINHALPSLQGELLAVFDADYVPSVNFLQRTVGFFQSLKVALVQTPQNFFNDDPITTNLGLQGIVNNEQNYFFRYLQPSRDAFNAVICCGSCFVIRRTALDEIGGIPTDSIAEDMFTSIRLQALGYEIKYLNEPLSAGMSAEDTSSYTNQRLRWGRGTLQLLFCNPNPLTTPGLNWGQRIYHGMSVLYWVNAVPRLIFLLLPSLCILFELVPLKTSFEEVLYFFLPLHLYNLLSYSWLSQGWRSLLWSDVYEVMLCIPMTRMVFQTLRNPFGQGFKVTPKGLDNGQRIRPNWGLIMPLVFVLGLMGFTLGEYALNATWKTMGPETLWINGVWSIYNIAIIGAAILAAIDVPQRRCPRFNQSLDCSLKIGDWVAKGQTVNLSEAGAHLYLKLPKNGFPQSGQDCQLLIPAQIPKDITLQPCWPAIQMSADLRWGRKMPDQTIQVGVQFQQLPLSPYRALIEGLFCQPGQWPDVTVPEYRTAWALLTSLWRLHPLIGSRG